MNQYTKQIEKNKKRRLSDAMTLQGAIENSPILLCNIEKFTFSNFSSNMLEEK